MKIEYWNRYTRIKELVERADVRLGLMLENHKELLLKICIDRRPVLTVNLERGILYLGLLRYIGMDELDFDSKFEKELSDSISFYDKMQLVRESIIKIK